jgi:uncharacterized protein YybS (DUF2232 family)
MNARALVEGAILAALTAIVGIAYNVPIVGMIAMFWPVPIILVGYRNDFKTSILSAVVAAAIIGLLVNPIIALILLMVYALPGAMIGLMMKRNASPYTTILVGGLIFAFTAILEFVLMLEMLFGKSALELLLNLGKAIDDYSRYLIDMFQSATEIYRQLGVDETVVMELMDKFSASIEGAISTLPAVVILGGIFVAFINFKLVRLILRRMGYHIEDIRRFSEWRLNEKQKVPMLIITAITLGLGFIKIASVQYIYTNLLPLIMFVYGLLGLSVVTHFAEKAGLKYEIPKPLIILFIGTLLLTLKFIFPFIGMFDLTANVRRLDRNIHGGVQ